MNSQTHTIVINTGTGFNRCVQFPNKEAAEQVARLYKQATVRVFRGAFVRDGNRDGWLGTPDLLTPEGEWVAKLTVGVEA